MDTNTKQTQEINERNLNDVKTSKLKSTYNEQINVGYETAIHSYPQVIFHDRPVYAHSRQYVGKVPCSVRCPSCFHHVITKVEFQSTPRTHKIVCLLCLLLCWPCAWMPYVMDSCKNANHYCPNCNSYIGAYEN